MYLAGIDIYDIMKDTGHTTPVILKKYIKASNLEVARNFRTSMIISIEGDQAQWRPSNLDNWRKRWVVAVE